MGDRLGTPCAVDIFSLFLFVCVSSMPLSLIVGCDLIILKNTNRKSFIFFILDWIVSFILIIEFCRLSAAEIAQLGER